MSLLYVGLLLSYLAAGSALHWVSGRGLESSCLTRPALLVPAAQIKTHLHRLAGLPLSRSLALFASNDMTAGALHPGQVLLAEVDDIVGGVADPTALFRVRGRDLPVRMSTAALRPNEKLALQTGTMMKVIVTKVEADGSAWVALDRNAASPGPMTPTSLAGGTAKQTTNTSPSVPSSKPPTKKASKSPPALLLNNLKTGMKLPGVVNANTHYAAFVDIGASRLAKGGLYTKVNGLLHNNDIHTFKKADLDKGKPVTVYIKEVFKNSGKFSLTLDPLINKSRILEAKARIKQVCTELAC
jgi:hypothetical protein